MTINKKFFFINFWTICFKLINDFFELNNKKKKLRNFLLHHDREQRSIDLLGEY